MTFDREAGVYEALRKELRKFTPLSVNETRRRGQTFQPVSQPPSGSVPTIFVAASDATENSKSRADYLGDGTADEVEIQAALDELANTGGRLLLSEGTFNLEDGLSWTTDKQLIVQGMGETHLLYNAQSGSPTSRTVLTLDDPSNSFQLVVRDLTINGGTAEGSPDAATQGVFAQAWCLIENVRVTRVNGVGMLLWLDSDTPQYTRVTSCLVDNNSSHGINTSKTGFGLLNHNWFYSNTGSAVHSESVTTGPLIDGNYLSANGNTFTTGGGGTYTAADNWVNGTFTPGSSATDTTAIHDNVANEITAVTAKTTPADADEFLLEDSAAAYVKKAMTWANLVAPLVPTDGSRQADYIDLGGLTGATSASRYVGATTTGAPASGTFAKGDYVIAQDGNIYVCTVAGSPGTWVAVGATAATDSAAIHDDTANEISAITEKTTPVDADLVIIEDSAASYVKKKAQLGNLPGGGATLPGWVDAFIGTTDSTHFYWDGNDLSTSFTAQTVSGSATWTESNNLVSVVANNQTADDVAAQLTSVSFSVGDEWVVPVMGMLFPDNTGSTNDLFYAGICFTDGTATTSNFVGGHIQLSGAGSRLLVGRFGTNTDTNVGAPWVSDETENITHWPIGLWIKLKYQAANSWRLSFSPDGITYSSFGESDMSKTMTPTHVGLFTMARANSTAYDGIATFGPLLKVA